MEVKKARCPGCGTVQKPHRWSGVLDVCDNCGRTYHKFVNSIEKG